MITNDLLSPLIGGLFIGVAVSLMLLLMGRVTGMTGIVNGIINREKNDWVWRVYFVAGLLVGGLILFKIRPDYVVSTIDLPLYLAVLGGFISGVGGLYGSGCISGHGICGLSRFSPRSFVATICFMLIAGLTVFIVRHVLYLGVH